MFSASHWKILAVQTAAELRQRLPAGAVYLRLENDDDSAFAKSFNLFLADELARRDIFVSNDRGDRKLRVDVQVVTHSSGPPADPFAFTFLGGAAGLGVWLAESRPLVMAVDSFAPVGAAAGAAIDLKRDLMPPATSTEVVVSTAIIDGGYQTVAKADVFYVQTANRGEYAPRPVRIIPVVGN